VFALAGVLVIEAAVTYQPSKAGGLDKALLTLRNQPFGEFLLILAALGLIIFGVYGLCEARWRKVQPADLDRRWRLGPGSRRRRAALIVARGWPTFAVKASGGAAPPPSPCIRAARGKGWPSYG
jgi:Domain of Unknown Function (DUF1206)